MLSTSDNPYNPWTQFDSWYNWDQMMGYNLSGYLARFTNNLSGMSEEDEALLNQEAKLRILEENIYGNIIMVPQPEK
ncbi:hypothetical protein P162_0082 [Lactococcus phage P162]|uniref:Uncharacterized protein n=2 Tax=Nevevirus TaxID=2843430 RepID=X4YEE1_9CAUD|nr:hypothetical protein GJ20_gp76 [Lactococcus phage P092]YP_009036825.1 hypothetical protein GJ24_gp82 [Lactococcus phage P162]AHV83117.1 hypothetical protein P092_0076 [Lactococcus phage P092]AHV83279.1 hypothetical protein P162_0082 [Lactococcus phage P162]